MGISSLATKYKFQNWGAVRWNSRGGTKITTVVVHHTATTNFDSLPGVWVNREASAHYGIKDGVIRAYVDEDNRAWHAGNANSYSIGIECCNSSGDPTWGVSNATVDSLVKLIKDINKRYGRTMTIIGHRDVSATACPGPSLYPRLQEIRNRVAGGSSSSTTPAAPSKPAASSNYKVEAWNVKQVVDVNGLNIRTSQTAASQSIGTLNKGQTFNATRICRNGQNVNGYTTWFEVNGRGWVSGAYVTPVKAASAPAAPAATGGTASRSGTFTLNTAIKLRTAPNTGAGVIAVLSAGQKVKYDRVITDANGYVWIRQPRSGGYGYLATGESKNGKRTSSWGSGV